MKRYQGLFEFQAFYTLSWDKSDDDNERDPFTLRYAKITNLDAEYGYSDRDQRHRFNAYVLWQAPGQINVNASWQYRSAQPTSITVHGRAREHASGPDQPGRQRHDAQPREQGQPVQLGQPEDLAPVRLRRRHGGAHRRGLQPLQQPELQGSLLRGLLFNFDGTVQQGLGDPRQVQLGVRVLW